MKMKKGSRQTAPTPLLPHLRARVANLARRLSLRLAVGEMEGRAAMEPADPRLMSASVASFVVWCFSFFLLILESLRIPEEASNCKMESAEHGIVYT